jgi:oxygen-independent coproporphyrinogen-3 oxidase
MDMSKRTSALESGVPKALYLHVPFCPSICPYCDFHKMLRHDGLAASYLDQLEREAEELVRRHGAPLDTIYLGGGTPSMLADAELQRITHLLERTWGFPAALETTLEADPLTFDAERLRFFRQLGFSRLSIGLQSTRDSVLKFLGRRHSGAEGLDAVRQALDAGFEVSADLITAVPGQDVRSDLEALLATGVQHVSVYSLTVEPFTPFALRGVTVDEDEAADAFSLAEEILARHGLERYEVSNHALPGHESQHNQSYWHGAWYLALGPSAASFLPPAGEVTDSGEPVLGVRRTNPPIKLWLLGKQPEAQLVDGFEFMLESLMTGLRTRRGVNLAVMDARTGQDFRQRFSKPLGQALEHGLLQLDGDVLTATPAGLIRLNAVLRTFFALRESS